jgi:hypothetical protein
MLVSEAENMADNTIIKIKIPNRVEMSREFKIVQ